MKICKTCNTAKPKSDFYRDKHWLKVICKACENQDRTVRRKEAQAASLDIVQAVSPAMPDSGEYNASSIKILSKSEAYQRMPWLKADELAQRYGKDVDFIKRGLQACRSANVGEEYFVKRYLEEMKDIPMDEAVDYQSRVLQGLVKERD